MRFYHIIYNIRFPTEAPKLSQQLVTIMTSFYQQINNAYILLYDIYSLVNWM